MDLKDFLSRVTFLGMYYCFFKFYKKSTESLASLNSKTIFFYPLPFGKREEFDLMNPFDCIENWFIMYDKKQFKM